MLVLVLVIALTLALVPAPQQYPMTRPEISNISLIAAATAAGLMAGLFYAYGVSVVQGLRRLPDLQYLTAMQSINRAILNPVFFIGFIGTLILLPLCTYLNYDRPLTNGFWLLAGASALYIGGVILVTMFGNVPLNDALDGISLSTSSDQELKAQRLLFENKWNSLNMVRLVASFLSFIMVLIALSLRTGR